MSEGRLILGLDISPRNCGFYLLSVTLEEAFSQYVDLGPSDLKNSAEALQRLFSSLISFGVGKRIILAVLEGYAYNSFLSREISGERGGLAKFTVSRFLDSSPIPLITVAPRAVKSFISGDGGSKTDKSVVMETLKSNWGLPFETDHEADAGVLALMGVFSVRPNKMLSLNQSRIISTLQDRFSEELNYALRTS